MVALAIYYKGLSKTPARVSTITELVWPVSAIFIDYAFLGGSLTLTQWVGAIILLGAIYMIGTKQKVDPKAQSHDAAKAKPTQP